MKKKPINKINPISFYDEYTRFFKVLNAANCVNGWEYDDGINDMRGYIGTNGNNLNCYFTDIEHIFSYLGAGPCFREVFIPKECPIIMKNMYLYTPTYYSNNVIMGPLKLWTTDNIKWLIENGADISVNNYYIVLWSLKYNFEVFYFLQSLISDYSEDLWSKIVSDLSETGFL